HGYEEAIGKNLRTLKLGDMSPEARDALWQEISSGHEWQGELSNWRKGGELYWESIAITPIKDSKGDISHFLAINEEVTERKRAQTALEESEKKYRSLVRN